MCQSCHYYNRRRPQVAGSGTVTDILARKSRVCYEENAVVKFKLKHSRTKSNGSTKTRTRQIGGAGCCHEKKSSLAHYRNA